MGFDALFAPHASDQQARTILLDGGLGTTLGDVFHKDIAHALWSTRLVDDDEASIIAAHLAFLRAGSRVILTSTYQAAYESFRRAGYTDADAERLMRKSVALATEARRKYELETPPHMRPDSPGRPYIALSLGPYGATLETAAEFTGRYPPPYGPPPSSPLHAPAPASEEQSYEEALAAFHLSRLLVYARDAHTWDAIDIVAFETVPLVTEARAIRRAVARLHDWLRDARDRAREMKPWYISFVFPGPRGEFPQHRCQAHAPQGPGAAGEPPGARTPYSPREVAQSALSPPRDGAPKMARPNGLGINCTTVGDVFRVTHGFVAAVRDLAAAAPGCFSDGLPWLALSPNGGVAYDPVEGVWIDAGPLEPARSAEEWARSIEEGMPEQVLKYPPQWGGVFAGLMLGGCCKTGPDEIRALKEILSR